MKSVRTLILMFVFTSTLFAADFFETGISYYIGDRVNYNEQEYQCTFTHTSQSDWAPGTPGIWFWFKVSSVEEGGWIAGTDYAIGDITIYEGLSYECIVAHTALPGWEPAGSVLWELVEELTVTDYDGNVYTTVQIGDQIWTVENLKVTHYRNGDPISNVTDGGGVWKGFSEGAYCYYNNDIGNNEKHGALYNWNAVSDLRNIAPDGWHVPTDRDWAILKEYLRDNGYGFEGSGDDIAKSMAAKTNWTSSVEAGAPGNDLSINNSSGFSAFAGGYRHFRGTFTNIGRSGFWWSTTDAITSNAYIYTIDYWRNNLGRYFGHKSGGYSVRLVRDSN